MDVIVVVFTFVSKAENKIFEKPFTVNAQTTNKFNIFLSFLSKTLYIQKVALLPD